MVDDLQEQMQGNFLKYASYVILDRAIPEITDGLKPVQRRILHTLHLIDNGRFHKVANVVGQTMALHPHGDAAICDALVHLAQKGYLLDQQGNFGNPLTGDPAAAARYIETRLGPLARECLFNPALTEFVPSYDGRAQEPVTLPCKLPLLLILGVEGIAVGMSTRIFPHNLHELWQAQISLLRGEPIHLVPDFPSGGCVDASAYAAGRGKLRLRAKIVVADDKTIVIEELCPGTTTESLIRSIDEAAKRGKLRIESIHDYTAEHVHVEIKLPRGQHASDLIPLLYAFTECQVVLHGHCIAIRDGLPWEGDVHAILEHTTLCLQGYLRRELELEKDHLLEEIFQRSLERIFIEERLYKPLEKARSEEEIDQIVRIGLEPFHEQLSRVPTLEDRKRLCGIPIRRISLFDAQRIADEIAKRATRIEAIDTELKRIPEVTIRWIQDLIKRYGKQFPRKTRIEVIEEVDKKRLDVKPLVVHYEPTSGFLGTTVKEGQRLECTSRDKLLLVKEDGSYEVCVAPEKSYLSSPLLFLGVVDRERVFQCLYSTSEGLYAKRFKVEQFILNKSYRFLDPEATLLHLSVVEGEQTVRLHLEPGPRQRIAHLDVPMEEVRIKGVAARGIRLTTKPVKRIEWL